MVLPSLLYAPGVLLTGVLEVIQAALSTAKHPGLILGVCALVSRRKFFERHPCRVEAAPSGLTAGAVYKGGQSALPEEPAGRYIYETTR